MDLREPPRVLHLDAGRGFRGGQRQVAALVEGLVGAGWACRVLAADEELRARASAAGAEVSAWSPRGDLDPVAALAAARAMRAFRPALVHAHDARAHASGWIGSRLAGAPPLVVSRRIDLPVAGGPASGLKYRLPVARWLCVSAAVAARLAGAGIAPERIAVVPSGVDLAAPVPRAEARARLAIGSDETVVGTVAALTAEKGHDVLLEAVARVRASRPDVRFAWLGDGPLRAALEARRDALGLRDTVRFAGVVPDAGRWMGAFDLLAAPSRIEGLGTAAIEALAAGIPVVASDTGGLREVLSDCEAARLVPPGDAAALAEALLGMLPADTGRGSESTIARAARERASRYGIAALVAATIREYGVVRGRNPGDGRSSTAAPRPADAGDRPGPGGV